MLCALGRCTIAAEDTLRRGDIDDEAATGGTRPRQNRDELLQQDEGRGSVHGQHLQELSWRDAAGLVARSQGCRPRGAQSQVKGLAMQVKPVAWEERQIPAFPWEA